MAEHKVECQFLEGVNCKAISDSEEAKETRKDSCNNDNIEACCYLCSHYNKCKISCAYLGENKRVVKYKTILPEEIKCSSCNKQMVFRKLSLRVGGCSGLLKSLHPAFDTIGELEEELLPVILYICPKCGKLEFRMQEETKEKLIDNTLWDL
ncbi:MAG: hypothetical protein ACQCN3_05850 [Candidatus Bathyarchaeia archaeon]|jgi:hypothetical protein